MIGERDPLVVWLEEIRDFEGSTPQARENARLVLERLAATPEPEPAPEAAAAPPATADGKIDRIVEAAREETERGRKARRKS